MDLEGVCDRARDLYLAGDREPALRLWTEAAQQGSGRAIYNLGYDAESHGDVPKAKALYERAASCDPPFPLAIYNLSVLAISDQDLERAAVLAERAADLGVGLAAFNRGQIASWAGDLPTAIMWWERASELGDDGASAYNLGIQANEAGDVEAARAWFARSAELGYPDGMNNHAVLLRQAGHFEESVSWYERAATEGSTLAMRNLAEIAEVTGDHQTQRQWLERAAALGDALASNLLAASSESRMGAAGPGTRGTTFAWNNPSADAPDIIDAAEASGETQRSGSFCTACGSPLPSGARFCGQCGAPCG